MALTQNSANVGARWAVVWLSKGHWIMKEVEDDFAEAQRLFTLLVRAGRTPHIRSMNVGFPPPERIRKRMRKYNRKGAWWCPYCVRLRRFRMETRGVGQVYVCPVCSISSRDGNVKRFNPYALVVEVHRRTRGRRRPVRRRA